MTTTRNSLLYGLVLAGGKSTRMGYDKSLIAYYNKPQREHVFNLLGEFCARVFTSCKPQHNVPEHLQPLPDLFDVESPLNGILSAFSRDPSATWLTAPVDMPLLDGKTLEFLLSHRDEAMDATCFYDSDGQLPEPLLTLWEPRAYPALLEFYQKGNISPREFLLRQSVKLIKAPDAGIHVNINSVEELADFLAKKGGQSL